MKRLLVTVALGLLLGACAPGGAAEALPACQAEDSTTPCYWDSQNRGNGLGRSFIVEHDGTVVYLATSRDR